MNDHYYTAEPTSAHAYREFTVEALGVTAHFRTDAGVFSRDDLDTGTRVMLEALPPLYGRVLDLGCGWGPVGVLLGKRDPALDILMTDINNRAVELARESLRRNGVKAEVVQGDGYENVTGTFDWILTNPPIRAGKAFIYSLFADAKPRLNEGGSLILVIRKQQGAPSALKYLREIYACAEVIEREAGFWILRASDTPF